MSLSVHPVALRLENRDVLVIGFGRVGAAKARQVYEAGARVRVVTTECLVSPPQWLHSLEIRPYEEGDLEHVDWVVSATGDPATNDRVVDEARRRRRWITVVDDPGRSDVYFSALHRDGDLVVAVSTAGASPGLAGWVRDRIREVLPPGLGAVAERLRRERGEFHARGVSTEFEWRPRIEELVANSGRLEDLESVSVVVDVALSAHPTRAGGEQARPDGEVERPTESGVKTVLDEVGKERAAGEESALGDR